MPGMLDIMGDVSKALDHHQRALKLARENGSQIKKEVPSQTSARFTTMLLIGRRHWSFTLRRYRFLDRFALFKTEARALNNIGIAYYELGELQKALDYLQQSLPLMRAAGNKNSEACSFNIGAL